MEEIPMKTILTAFFLTLSATSAFAGPDQRAWMINWGTEDVNAGTICKVKEIIVLAQSVEDCVAIGGEATHTLTQSAEPIAK
jgi:hypothetical protein